jgi:hypothetical protein
MLRGETGQDWCDNPRAMSRGQPDRLRGVLRRSPHDLALGAAAAATLVGALIVVTGPAIGGSWQSSWVPNWAVSLWATAATIVVLDVVITRRATEAQLRAEDERLRPLRWLASRDLRRVSRKLERFIRSCLLSVPQPGPASDLSDEARDWREKICRAPLGGGYDGAFAAWVVMLASSELDEAHRRKMTEVLLPQVQELQRELERLTDVYIATGALTEGQISGIGMLGNAFHWLNEQLSSRDDWQPLVAFTLGRNYWSAGYGVERHGHVDPPDRDRGGNFRDALGVFPTMMTGARDWHELIRNPPPHLDAALLELYWRAVRRPPAATDPTEGGEEGESDAW